MPSIVLTKEEHQKFTAAWRDAIGYVNSKNTLNTQTATRDTILKMARDIYQDYPELLKVIEEAFK
jgi:hypothetical protein